MSTRSARPIVLLTGATGFIGAHVARALDRSGWRVRAVVHTPRRSRPAHCDEAFLADVRDEAALERAVRGAEAVVHLAARLGDAASAELTSVNVDGTRALCAAMRRGAPGARLVYVSSAAAVGPGRDGRALCEGDEPRPLTAYGESKLAAERVVRASGLRAVSLRPPLVVGEGARGLRPLLTLARVGVAPVPSGAIQTISVIDVQDLAAYCVTALTSAEGCFHVACPEPDTFPGLVEALGVLLGRRVRRLEVPRAWLRAASHAASSAARFAGPAVALATRLDVMLARSWLLDTRLAERTLGPCAQRGLDRALRALVHEARRADAWGSSRP